MKRIFRVAIISIILYFLVSLLISYNIVAPAARHIDVAPDFVAENFQNVSFKTSDNLTLKGWLFEPDASKFIIFVPGFLDNRTNGGYYGVLLAKELISQGYGVLMYDPRARGDSDGKLKLVNEELDVVAAVKFLQDKTIRPQNIGIFSYSTGSVSTLLAIDRINNIGGVVIDSTPADLKQVIDHVLSIEQNIPAVFLPGVHFLLVNVYGLDAKALNQVGRLSKAQNLPLLILHPKNDRSVPYTDSEIIRSRANSNSKLVLFPEGSHIESYKFNKDMFREVVFGYLSERLK